MAVRIKQSVRNLSRLRKSLRTAKENLDKRLSPTGRRVATLLLSMTQKSFRTGGRFGEQKKWEPLSVFTRFVRAKRAGALQISCQIADYSGTRISLSFVKTARSSESPIHYAMPVYTNSAGDHVGVLCVSVVSRGKTRGEAEYTGCVLTP